MKNIISTGSKVLGWVIMLLAFSSIGFLTDNPKAMVPLYLVFFLLVFIGTFGYNIYKTKNAKQLASERATGQILVEQGSKNLFLLKLVLGVILLLLALIAPFYTFKDVGFTTGILVLLTVITILLVVIGIVAIMLINKHKLHFTVIGYLILIGLCSVPALVMMQHDKSYHALGTAYYLAIVIAMLSWVGVTLIEKNAKKYLEFKP